MKTNFHMKNIKCGTLLIHWDQENRVFPLEELERSYILKVLDEFKGQRRRTADALGIALRTLTYKLKRYREQGHAVVPPIRQTK